LLGEDEEADCFLYLSGEVVAGFSFFIYSDIESKLEQEEFDF
jgi:hypothetical protein